MRSEQGNILFLILIAVALFAALSYAVSQTTRSGGSNVSEEKAAIEANRLLSWATSIQQAMMKITITNQCDVDNLTGDEISGDPTDHPGPCNLFDQVNGGGAIYKLIRDGDTTVYASNTNPPYPGMASNVFNTLTTHLVSSLERDTIFFMFNIRQDVCKGVNKILHIVTADGEPPFQETPYEGGWTVPRQAGPLPLGFYDYILGRNASGQTELAGHAMGCYRATRGGYDMGYHFFAALKEY